MSITSHDACKIDGAEARVTRVRRIESWALWCKYRLHIVATRQRHVQSNVTVGPVEPYVWYPPPNYGPKELLENLDTSINDHLLFHGTDEANIEDILAQGIDFMRG